MSVHTAPAAGSRHLKSKCKTWDQSQWESAVLPSLTELSMEFKTDGQSCDSESPVMRENSPALTFQDSSFGPKRGHGRHASMIDFKAQGRNTFFNGNDMSFQEVHEIDLSADDLQLGLESDIALPELNIGDVSPQNKPKLKRSVTFGGDIPYDFSRDLSFMNGVDEPDVTTGRLAADKKLGGSADDENKMPSNDFVRDAFPRTIFDSIDNSRKSQRPARGLHSRAMSESSAFFSNYAAPDSGAFARSPEKVPEPSTPPGFATKTQPNEPRSIPQPEEGQQTSPPSNFNAPPLQQMPPNMYAQQQQWPSPPSEYSLDPREQMHQMQLMQHQMMLQWMRMQEQQQRLAMYEQQQRLGYFPPQTGGMDSDKISPFGGFPQTQQQAQPQPQHQQQQSPRHQNATSTGAQQKPAMRQHRGQVSGLLQQHKNTGYRPSLNEVLGHVCEFACDSHGSRLIQFMMESLQENEKRMLVEETLPELIMLMQDTFGNYVIQNFLVHSSKELQSVILDTIQENLLSLSKQSHGCRVVQRAIDVAEFPMRMSLISQLCSSANLIRTCARDPHATHVLQKCICTLQHPGAENSSEYAKVFRKVEEAVAGEIISLAKNPHASRLVLLIMGNCDPKRSSAMSTIMSKVESSFNELMWDQHGNFAMQHILDNGTVSQAGKVQKAVASRVLEMAKHKFASHLVEKCLSCATPDQVRVVIDQMLDKSGDIAQSLGLEPLGSGQHIESDGTVFLMLMKDPYANFVVQRALDASSGALREELAEEIHARSRILSKFTYGRHLIKRLNQKASEK